MTKSNYKPITYIVIILSTLLLVFFLAPKNFFFQKTKAENNPFSGYQMKDKNSVTSSLPTSVTWHEPSFMETKKP
jgi:hypothetical protein